MDARLYGWRWGIDVRIGRVLPTASLRNESNPATGLPGPRVATNVIPDDGRSLQKRLSAAIGSAAIYGELSRQPTTALFDVCEEIARLAGSYGGDVLGRAYVERCYYIDSRGITEEDVIAVLDRYREMA